MNSIRNIYTQLYPPPAPLTEANLSPNSLHGKIYVVTGGNAGIGYELVKILFLKGAKVYMASRSRAKAEAAIQTISTECKEETKGEILFLELDLGDLESVKKAARMFGEKETRLDVLWNNAGVAAMPVGTKTKQGYELHLGTNCLGPFLFTQLLLPQLRIAAKSSPKSSVRILWTSSAAVDTGAPQGGIDVAALTSPPPLEKQTSNLNYSISKAGNWILASEFSNRVSKDGIVSVTLNPGNLSTEAWEKAPMMVRIIFSLINKDPKLGAYTNLWAGLSDDVTVEDGGRYVIPWGRWQENPRKDLVDAMETVEQGGTGEARAFWEWCKAQTKEYL